MARAFFGEDLEKALEKLNHQFWTVKVYVDANHSDKTGADADFRRKIESSIWEGYPSAEENEVNQIIAAQVKLIEDTLVPVLRTAQPPTPLSVAMTTSDDDASRRRFETRDHAIRYGTVQIRH